jgi:coniferyl-aldehyde dehydrogenase
VKVGSSRRAYQESAAALYPDAASGRDYTSIVNPCHYARLQGLIEDAGAHGAKIVDIGVEPGRGADRPHTLAPVVLGMTDDMRISREEIFGPVLPVITYRAIDEAIAYVNARARPLALYYFGSGGTDQRKVLTGTTSGNVMLNGTIMHVAQDDLPFGGVGASGIGPITASKASSVSATPRVSMRRAGGTSSNYSARHSGR